MDLIPVYYDDSYYCALHSYASLTDLDLDSRSQMCEKAKPSAPIISQSFQSIWMEFGLILMSLKLILSSPFNIQERDCLLVGCLTSQQHASVSQGRICSDNFTCCHTEIEVADQTFYLTQSQYTDTGPTSPSADPITPGAWQGSHWSANV